MRIIISILVTVFSLARTCAQEYKIYANREDSFSHSLMQLMNCGAEKFDQCKGSFLQNTPLHENEYRLTISFPGSAAGLLRFDGNDRNAYVEFRGYTDKKTMYQGMQSLISKIKNALGDQVAVSHPPDPDAEPGIQISSMGIKDKNGYFQPNIELLAGSSDNIYLYPKATGSSIKKSSQKYFILLKIYGGIPTYYYNVPPGIIAADKKIKTILEQVLLSGSIDFSSFSSHPVGLFSSKKKDTINLDGTELYLNMAGQNATCTMSFNAPDDSLKWKEQFEQLQETIQSAVGISYAYLPEDTDNKPAVFYFPKAFETKQPTVELYSENGISNMGKTFTIVIRSKYYHAVSRGLQIDK